MVKLTKTPDWYGPSSYSGYSVSEIIALVEGSFLAIFTFLKVLMSLILFQKVKVTVKSFAQVSKSIDGQTSIRNCIYVVPELIVLNDTSTKARIINSLLCIRVLAMYLPIVFVCLSPLIMMLHGEFMISMMAIIVFFFMKNAIMPSENIKKYYFYLISGKVEEL